MATVGSPVPVSVPQTLPAFVCSTQYLQEDRCQRDIFWRLLL